MAYTPPPTTPPVPQRGDRATFSGRVDAFLTWVAAIIPWMQGFLQQLTTLAVGGANSFTYNFDSSIADSDPGAGMLRLNNATQNLSTLIRIDPITAGADITGVIAALVARTSSIKGTIRIQRFNDLTAWMILDVIGFTANSGYYNLNVVVRASTSANPFTAGDQLVVFIDASGERGDNGVVGYAKFVDQKAVNVAGGSSIAGVQDRVLNTTAFNDIAGASLTGNIFTLPAGSYEIDARAPFLASGIGRLILFNVTDNTRVVYGATSDRAEYGQTYLTHKFVITAQKDFKLQQYLANAQATNGLGQPNGLAGYLEIFSEVVIRKV